MAKKIHLILIAVLCLQLIAASNLPPTSSPEGADASSTFTTTGELEENLEVGNTTSSCNSSDLPIQNGQFEQAVVELVNQKRAEAGLPPLKRYENLSNASRFHAHDMLADVYFNHDSYDRVNGNLQFACAVWDRITNYYSFSTAGENIAAGYTTPESVMAAWMASSGHRANILNPNFREIGVWYYFGDNQSYRHYWVQDFGARSDVYPLVVNRESSSTENRNISIYLYGTGVFTEYRIKDDFSEWSSWRPFQANATWTLDGPGNMTRTVTVELRKPNGDVLTSSDSIYLSGQPALGNLPASISFLYIRSTGILAASNHIIQPLNTGTNDVLTWSLSTNAAWINTSVSEGSTPSQQAIVTVKNPAALNLGSYTGSLTVTVTAPSYVSGSPVTIPVTLMVVDSLDQSVYLPAVQR